MILLKIFSIEGDLLGDKLFSGSPLVGDCFMFKGVLVYVRSRRWGRDGNLELIVDQEPA